MPRKSKKLTPAEKEAIIEDALEKLRNRPPNESPNFAEAAKAHECLNRWVLRRRFYGLSGSRVSAACLREKIPCPVQSALLDWCILKGYQGCAVNYEGIASYVELLIGERPTRHWVRQFRARWSTKVKVTSSRGLDPLRAQCFNRTTVCGHFDAFKKASEGVAIWNVYNADEQGIQMGGGRKRTGALYIFALSDKNHYRLQPESLQLVTILEAVCADGTKQDPGIIFSGKESFELGWFTQQDSKL
jgi:hypothetical protein